MTRTDHAYRTAPKCLPLEMAARLSIISDWMDRQKFAALKDAVERKAA